MAVGFAKEMVHKYFLNSTTHTGISWWWSGPRGPTTGQPGYFRAPAFHNVVILITQLCQVFSCLSVELPLDRVYSTGSLGISFAGAATSGQGALNALWVRFLGIYLALWTAAYMYLLWIWIWCVVVKFLECVRIRKLLNTSFLRIAAINCVPTDPHCCGYWKLCLCNTRIGDIFH